MVKIYKYYNAMYGAKVHCVVCSPSEFLKWGDSILGTYASYINALNEGVTLYFRECDETKYDVVIWLNSDYDDLIPTLAHECFHAARHILINRGVRLSEDDEAQEALAYLLGDIFKNLFKKMQKPERKQNAKTKAR